MCLLRLNDYTQCGHSYIKPLFCDKSSRSSSSDTPQFCTNVSNEGLESIASYCQHCELVNTIANDRNLASQHHGLAATEREDLLVTLENMRKYLETDEGVLVTSMSENCDRGLGEPLEFNPKYVLALPKEGKGLNVRFAETDEIISEHGGCEWQDEDVDHDVDMIPHNLRFAELKPAQRWAWWRDRKTDSFDNESLYTLTHFWGQNLSGLRRKNKQWKMNRLLDWIETANPANGNGEKSVERLPAPGILSSKSYRTIQRIKIRADTMLASRLCLPNMKELTMEDCESDGVTIRSAGSRVHIVPFSDGRVVQWRAK